MPKKIFVTAHYNPEVNRCRRLKAEELNRKNRNGGLEIIPSGDARYSFEEAKNLGKSLRAGDEVTIVVDPLAKADQKLHFEKVLSPGISKKFVPSFWPYSAKTAVLRGFWEAANYFLDRLILLGVENGDASLAEWRMNNFYPRLEGIANRLPKYR